MKQNITPEQLNELSAKQRKKLHDWCIDKKWYKLPPKKDWVKWTVPFLSIGQMIEFLMEHDKHRSFISWGTVFTPEHDGTSWFGRIEHDKKRNTIVFRDGFGFGELVNTLWEACKEVLE